MEDNITQSTKYDLKKVAGILIRATGISFLILIVWFGWLLTGPEFAYRNYSAWFGISKQDFILLNLFGLMGFKIFCTTFFLIPFAAIKLYEKSNYKQM